MPAYNEQRTLGSAIEEVLSTRYPAEVEVELIVVDDGSTDATGEILREFTDPRIVTYRHPRNLGKGAALQTAATLATGSHLVPFDADHEYSSADLPTMLVPVLQGRCDIVYGTRLFGVNTVYQSYRQAMGNRLLTFATNVTFDAYLSDLHSCLKLLPLELFRTLKLRENGFGLDTEITAQILKMGARPFEVPISYHSRSYMEGKKVNWRHGVECLRVLGRVRFARARTPLPAYIDSTRPSAPRLIDAVDDELARAFPARDESAEVD